MQERRAQGLGVQAEAGADLCHLDRVGDEVLARSPALVGVALAGEGEGALDGLGVDLARALDAVLLDHRQQVAEQGALVVGQLLSEVGQRHDRRGLAATGANPRVTLAIGGSLRAVGPAPVASGFDAASLAPLGCSSWVVFALLRNRLPSSWRSR